MEETGRLVVLRGPGKRAGFKVMGNPILRDYRARQKAKKQQETKKNVLKPHTQRTRTRPQMVRNMQH